MRTSVPVWLNNLINRIKEAKTDLEDMSHRVSLQDTHTLVSHRIQNTVNTIIIKSNTDKVNHVREKRPRVEKMGTTTKMLSRKEKVKE